MIMMMMWINDILSCAAFFLLDFKSSFDEKKKKTFHRFLFLHVVVTRHYRQWPKDDLRNGLNKDYSDFHLSIDDERRLRRRREENGLMGNFD